MTTVTLNKIKGISGIELLIVAAVLGVIIAVVLPQFGKSRELQVLDGAAGDILAVLRQARAQTLAAMDSSSYGVRFEADEIIIFKGTSYSSGDPDNYSIAILEPASITNVTLGGVSASSGDFYFRRLSGSPSRSGTVTVSSPSYARTITLSATGAASAQ